MSAMIAPCDDEIFKTGQPIAALDGRSASVETWVRKIAAASGQRVDWHYVGGVARVLFLGNRAKVDAAIDATLTGRNVRILRRFK